MIGQMEGRRKVWMEWLADKKISFDNTRKMFEYD